MDTRGINLLNIFLMVASCWLAFILPFKLFLFSYAVLGPLHYLTETNWLSTYSFFTKSKGDFKWLTILGVLFFFGFLINHSLEEYSILHPLLLKSNLDGSLLGKIGFYMVGISTLTAFLLAFSMNVFSSRLARIVTALVAIICGFVLNEIPFYLHFIGFLPTLVHVILFTAVFILSGAFKKNSLSEVLSFFVFVLCLGNFFWISYEPKDYQITSTVWENYLSSGIHFINVDLISIIDSSVGIDIYLSKLGLSVQRMIAFGYTYHYLNWFSKTSIIGWHRIPRIRILVIFGLWLLSVAIYFYSYQLDILLLLFLSILHVFYEFPLNHQTVIGLPKAFKKSNFFGVDMGKK